MKHLTPAEILQAVNGDTFPPHMNECGRCVETVTALMSFRQTGLTSGARKTKECFDTEDIADYLEGLSSDPDKIRKHIARCDYCFDLSAYYFAESERMRADKEPSTPPAFVSAAVDIVPRGRSVIRSFRLPRWLAIPLPALACAAILWIALFASPPLLQVATLGTSPFSLYKNDLPSKPYVYFAQQGRPAGTLPSRMRVTAGGGSLRFDWAAVEGAERYHFVLQETQHGAPRTIIQTLTKAPSYRLPASLLTRGATYRWISAGTLAQNRYFEGTLEFALR